MKRALALLVGGVLILGSALAAHAQAPTVSFGGQMRVYGFAFDNITDFRDSNQGANRDSQSFYFQRWRLFTNVESADKKARVVWGLEVGDITWGRGGGAQGGEYLGCPGNNPVAAGTAVIPGAPPPAGSPPGTPGGAPTTVPVVVTPTPYNRTGQGSGGCLGADGVNVETKNAYLWFDTGQWLPGSSATIGIQNAAFMTGPIGGVFDDDVAAIKLNMKFDPVDVEVWTGKFGEGAQANADDTDAYVARVGVNLSKDLRVTVEGMLVDEKSLAGFNLGDSFWVGATVGAKVGDVQLDGAVVYGQRAFSRAIAAGPGNPFEESGFGAFVTARVPIGPLSLFAIGWYTTGDDTVGPAGCGINAATGAPQPGTNAGCGGSGGTGVAARRLPGDSDKLPVPNSTGMWFGGGGPYIAEWLFGNSSIGTPGIGQVQYADPTGTWGFGASVSYALTPAFSVGGGAAYVGATDQQGPYGDALFEIDAGATYRFNPNLVFNLFGGFLIPDAGDEAWAVAFRTQYSF
jgi:hypothetical protein